jgi:hypothetical protein
MSKKILGIGNAIVDVFVRVDDSFLSKNNQERVLDLIEIFDIAMIDFSKKIKILKYIVKKYLIDFNLNKENSNLNIENLFSDLTYIMEKRNELAHRRPNIDNNDFLELSWIKTHNDKLKQVELKLNEELKEDFLEKCATSYIKLIELELNIIKI